MRHRPPSIRRSSRLATPLAALSAVLLATPLAAQAPPPLPGAPPGALPGALPQALPVLLDTPVPTQFQVGGAPDDAGARGAPRVRATWQHGVLTIDAGGGPHRFAGPGGQFVESRRPLEFLRRLGADSTVRLRDGVTHGELQAATLEVLGADGWELVGCQFVRREGTSDDTVCHLKRPHPPARD